MFIECWKYLTPINNPYNNSRTKKGVTRTKLKRSLLHKSRSRTNAYNFCPIVSLSIDVLAHISSSSTQATCHLGFHLQFNLLHSPSINIEVQAFRSREACSWIFNQHAVATIETAVTVLVPTKKKYQSGEEFYMKMIKAFLILNWRLLK